MELVHSNTAAQLSRKQTALELAAAKYTPPAADEIVVRNHAVAVNPLDWIMQVAGDFLFNWIKYPFVLGSDSAGEVVEVGSAVTRFKVGDRVLGHAVGTDPKRNRAAEGSFQTYTVLLERMASPIPADLAYEEACVLPLGLSTAACGLFEKDQLALDPPSLSPSPNGKTLLVWGGSTSVGSNALQLAVAAGYEVFTTASPRNFDYCKQLGASRVFDYSDPNVVRDLITALQGKTIAGALAIGPRSPEACAAVVRACKGRRFVSMATFPISFDQPLGQGVPMPGTLLRFLWFSVSFWLATRLHGTRSKFIFGSSLVHSDVGRAVYEGFLPEALAAHRFVAAPRPQVVGTGLESIQAALDLQRKGVSARKLVVTLPPTDLRSH
jgi:NADPH:quinone reductase-like Zn-dependent oxidoreductase